MSTPIGLTIPARDGRNPQSKPDRGGQVTPSAFVANGLRGGSAPVGLHTVRLPDTTSVNSPARVNKGMLEDYYNRVYAIPPLLSVQNPIIGQQQPYQIWNAFLQPNAIIGRTDIDATGLVNDAVVSETFRAVQVKSFSVVVTALAPIRVEALYRFDFTLGDTDFRFRAVQAVVITKAPESAVQTLEYKTDVMRARNGTERRFAIRGNEPRQSFNYDLLLVTDAERRQLRLDKFINNLAPAVLPLWHEPFRVTNELSPGGTVITYDDTFNDFVAGDVVYITDPTETISEINRVEVVAAGQITLSNVINFSYPIGSKFYPTSTVQVNDNNEIRHFAVNAITELIRGIQIQSKTLGGNGATLDFLDGLPILKFEPSGQGQVQENFNRQADVLDYGGVQNVFSGATYSNMPRVYSFFVRDRIDWQWWKLFLDTIFGRREPFLMATFQSDYDVVAHSPGTNSFTIANTPDLQDWFDSGVVTRLQLTLGPGETVVYRSIVSITDLGGGEAAVLLDDFLPDLGPDTVITRVSLVQLSRLGADRIRIQHFSTHTRVNLTVETVEQ